ncbi:Abi-alpha family protein [Lachnoclostridium sp. An181]|uniref:Abi-alpha family protein n=1 Tax=Lachnoclostridium sp. An181 TaxID=1965575 RepID=UPI003FA59F96
MRFILNLSFPGIIKQLSPVDARFLLLFKKQSTFPIAELTERDLNGGIKLERRKNVSYRKLH